MKSPAFAFTLFFAALAVVPLASAQAQGQIQMNQQAERDFEKVDARLNVVYKAALAGLDDVGKKKLQAAQRAWLAYRDAEAEFQADGERGGSMAPMIYSKTETELTEARIKALQRGQQ